MFTFKTARRAIIALFLIALFSNSNAQSRYFANMYLTYTPAQGEFEFEFWQNAKLGKETGYYHQWISQIECEYGLTDRLTTSLYFNFLQQKSSGNLFESKPLQFSTASIEFRYRLTEQGEYFIDPALYFECLYHKDYQTYEPKLLFTKRMGRFISAMNIGAEIEKVSGKSTLDADFEVTLGLAYDLNSNIALGMEFKHERAFEDLFEEEENNATFLGPTVNLNYEGVNLVLSFLAQINGNPSSVNHLELLSHEKYELRMVLGIEM